MPTDLSSLDVDEVSLVRKPAIKRLFSLLKADTSGDLEMSGPVVKAMSTPVAGEDEVVAKLGDGASDAQVEAAVVAHRLGAFIEKAGGSVTYQAAPAASHNRHPDDPEGLAGSGTTIHPMVDFEGPAVHHNTDGEPVDEFLLDSADDLGDDDDDAVLDGSMDRDAFPSADNLAKRDYSAEQRRRLAQRGEALPDGWVAKADDLSVSELLGRFQNNDPKPAAPVKKSYPDGVVGELLMRIDKALNEE